MMSCCARAVARRKFYRRTMRSAPEDGLRGRSASPPGRASICARPPTQYGSNSPVGFPKLIGQVAAGNVQHGSLTGQCRHRLGGWGWGTRLISTF